VIALTHMRMKNDITLAEKVPGVDIILGGHDHDYHIEQVNITSLEKKQLAPVD